MMIAQGFTAVTCAVNGPMQRTVTATYALRDGTAVIEMASAAGLGLLGMGGPNSTTARTASTLGVGALIADALDRGADRIVVGVGGSATTDGGAGLLVGLGARLLDVHGDPLYPTGHDLLAVESLDISGLDSRLREVDLVVACDVDNPLTGPYGAAAMYGPQKGANRSTVVELDHAMGRWADVVAHRLGRDLRELPGVGAAGGAAFGLAAVLGARLTSGIELLLELGGFGEVLEGAALVVVGEGSLDAQSLRGKGPIGVARAARRRGIPVVAVAGRSSVTVDQLNAVGVDAVYTLTALEADELQCMVDADTLIERIGSSIARDYPSVAAGISVPRQPCRLDRNLDVLRLMRPLGQRRTRNLNRDSELRVSDDRIAFRRIPPRAQVSRLVSLWYPAGLNAQLSVGVSGVKCGGYSSSEPNGASLQNEQRQLNCLVARSWRTKHVHPGFWIPACPNRSRIILDVNEFRPVATVT